MEKQKITKITAKERAKNKLVEYLGDPNNVFLSRAELSTIVLGYKNKKYINKIFTSEEIHNVEKEALEVRRKKYSPHISEIDKSLIRQAKAGDVAACKLAYQRFEGWSEKTISENIGDDAQPISITIEVNDARKPKGNSE